MRTNTVKNTPAVPPKSAQPMPSTHPTSAQAAAAFAAHLKKNQAEQLSRSMRHARRDSVGRLLAADESAPGIPQLLGAGDEAVTGIGERQQSRQEQSEARQQNQQEREKERESDSEQTALQAYRQDDAQQERQHDRYDAGTSLLGRQMAAMDTGDGAMTDALAERLAPLSTNDGLFDLLHPDGSVLSVAVTHAAARVSFLLSTTSDSGNTQLRDCKMELEQRLGRRIGKDVVIAIL